MRKGLVVTLFTISFGAFAQEADTLVTMDLEPISVSSTRYESRPSFNLLEAEGLDINNGFEVNQVLNQVPGIYMHSGTLSTNRITIRGIGNRSLFSTSKIRAYIEDIPITTGIGETSLEDIDLNLISEVEVWKGPTASRFGAGLGGLIRYRLKEPRESSVTMNTLIGDAGLFRSNVSVSFKPESSLGSLLLNYNTTKTDGWRSNSEYKREGMAIIGKKSGSRSTFQYIVNLIDLRGEIPSSLNRNDYDDDPSKAAFTWNQVRGYEDYRKTMTGLSYTRDFGNNWIAKFSAFANTRTAYESRPFNILDESSFAMGGRQVFSKTGSKSIIRGGIEVYNESYDWRTYETDLGVQGDLLSDQEETRNYVNIFKEWEYSISPSVTMELGVNLNNTNYDLVDLFDLDQVDLTGEYKFNWKVSPNINLRYQSNDRSLLYFNLSNGISYPSLEETLTPDGLINTDIGAESGWNFEWGFRSNLSDAISLDLSIYNMIVDDLLVNRVEEDINTGFDQIVLVNAGKTNHFGSDILLNASLLSSSNASLDASVTYSYQNYKFNDFFDEDAQEDYSGNVLTGTVPHRFYNTLRGRFSMLYFNLSHQYVDEMPMRDDNSVFSDSYNLLNLKLGLTSRADTDTRWEIYGGINNLADQLYAPMVLINAGSFGGNAPRYFYPGQPRNFFAGIKLTKTLSGE